MHFRLLGAFEAVVDGQPVAVGRRSERCLLALLLLEPGDVVPVDRLIDLLWGDGAPEQARRTLHSYVARLRSSLARHLDAPRIVTVGSGYQVKVDASRVDVHVFRALVRAARRETDPADRSAMLAQALRLWRGPLLADLGDHRIRDRFSPALDELRIAAAEAWLAAELALGRHHEALAEATRLAHESPAHERLVGLRMLALYRSGRTADALAAFTALREQLAETTGADPGRELRDLHTAMLRNDPALDDPTVLTDPAAPADPTEPVASTSPQVSPAELPPDLSTFAGRSEHLDLLDAMLPGPGAHTPAVIAAIAGMGGIGKTTLAVHWAHQVRERYPDGQLYLNLRGYDPFGAAITAMEALHRLLTGLGVSPLRVPADFEARVSLYRSLLADRRVLVILDNARDAEQVRPLLPGAVGCLTVVTSRSQLTGLVAVDGARLLSVAPLSTDEARELLAGRLGQARIEVDPDAVAEIIARCGGLPLALAIVAARAVVHADFPLAALADELRRSAGALEGLQGVDPASDVRTVFSWSYAGVGTAAARLFRLLGLHPGPDIGTTAAASLAGISERDTRRLLAELADANLLTEHLPGRYTLHDLLRAYAAEKAQAVDDDEHRRAAVGRMLDHYAVTAQTASALRDAHRLIPTHLVTPAPGVTPEPLSDSDQAQAWLVADHPTVIAATKLAAASGFDTHAWQLAWAVTQFLNRQGRWDELLALQDVALGAVERLDDREGQAYVHRFLGIGHLGRGGFAEARRHYRHTLELFGSLGHSSGQGYAHLGVNLAYDGEGRYRDALDHAHQALAQFRAAGDRAGQAKALNAIGWLSVNLGDVQTAVTYCRKALKIHQELDDEWGAAHNWDSLGLVHHQLGEHAAAIDCYDHALDLFRRTGDSYFTASTLTRLGDSRQDSGDPDGAREAWQEALRTLDQLGHPDATKVRARLS